MTNEPHVEVDLDSILTAWEATGDDFWLRLHTDQIETLDLIKASLAIADVPDEEPGFGSMDLTTTPYDGYAVMVGPGLSVDTVHAWVHRFADALQDHGITGRLEGAIPAWGPMILGMEQEPTPTLYARFALPSSPGPLSAAPWEVPAAQTREAISILLDWVLAEADTVYVHHATFGLQVPNDLDLRPHLEQVLETNRSFQVDAVDVTGNRARHAALGLRANGLFQSVGRPWRETVDELIDLARRLPPPLDLAFIRIAQRDHAALQGLDSVQPLAHVREGAVRDDQHLLNRYLPDAHGAQIVNDAHLNAARDLSRWHITDLGQGRHLVVAPDLKAWYGNGLPDPDTLDRARADWAGAILTEKIVSADWRSHNTTT